MALGGWARAQDDFQANEYEIKAAYLVNFANFVEWPGSKGESVSAPIRVCVLGSDPVGGSLSRMMAGRLSQDKSLLLRHMARSEPVTDCQILYISPSEGKYIPQILDSLRGASVLTVGENDQFAAWGGMIQLVMENNRIRFKINPSAASRAGIRISSKLLALAEIVSPSAAQLERHQAAYRKESLKSRGRRGLLLNGETHRLDEYAVAHLNRNIVAARLHLWDLHDDLVGALLDDRGFVIHFVIGEEDSRDGILGQVRA